MLKIGEIRTGKELGRINTQKWQKFIWTACEICGKERWGQIRKNEVLYKRCYSCTRKIRYVEKKLDGRGYIHILVRPDDFFYPMVNAGGFVLEHRLVMAKYLGRCLQSWEVVHHKGIRVKGIENRSDNLIDNLQLVSDLGHKQLSQLEAIIIRLRKKIETLQMENTQLRKRK